MLQKDGLGASFIYSWKAFGITMVSLPPVEMRMSIPYIKTKRFVTVLETAGTLFNDSAPVG